MDSVLLCITESQHIRSVKEPWQQSNRKQPLSQILVTNQWLDQLAAAQTDFKNCGMLNVPHDMCQITVHEQTFER